MQEDWIEIRDNTFIPLPQKALYWREEKALILADVHLGKSTHFRKSGVPIPFESAIKNYLLLDDIFQRYIPEKVIFLGDLFHSHINLEWNYFNEWITRYSNIEFLLIKGNHDIFPNELYLNAGLEIFEEALVYNKLLFTHAPIHKQLDEKYVISGHVHPRIMMKGNGNQRILLPGFIFGQKQALVPAFGSFTGGKLIFPHKEDNIFVIHNEKIFRYNQQVK